MALRANRMARELKLLSSDPPPGIAVWPVGDGIGELRAQLRGPEGTVYEGGTFDVSVSIPERYPIEPPRVRFATPVLHPNIDGGGRVCLDTLSLPPKGAWRPSLSLGAVLSAVRALLSEPNGDDGLVEEVAHEFRHARRAFDERARAMTRRHAMGKGEGEAAAVQGKENADADAAAAAAAAAASVPTSKGNEEEEGAKQQQQQQEQQPPTSSRLQLGVKRPRGDENDE